MYMFIWFMYTCICICMCNMYIINNMQYIFLILHPKLLILYLIYNLYYLYISSILTSK